MSVDSIAVLSSHERPFFSSMDGALRQWIDVTIASRLPAPLEARVTISAAGMNAETAVQLQPGVWEYRCLAPQLWPAHPPEPAAALSVEAGTQRAEATVPVGGHRPWTVYLLADACTDATWVYDDLRPMKEDDAAITLAEMDVADAYQSGPDASRNHYNLVHHREIEYFLEVYPDQEERLVNHVRRGTIELNPFRTMCSTSNLTLEELIRHFYPARRWAAKEGVPLRYANHQETPTIAWATATILAQSGIGHLVKSILPYECPWVRRLEEPPVFYWEGPDGSRILVRRRNENYVEGNFVLRGLRATNTALHELVLPAYAALGERYPFSAVALVGCYGDLAPHLRTFAAKKAAAIAAYNAQGWEYPRLVNSSHGQFWQDIDAQIAARRIDVPVFRGDYGAAWDAWPASLAHSLAGWRRAQERAGTADALAALLRCLDPEWEQANRARLAAGWEHMAWLSDHAWNGENDANRLFNAALRRGWQEGANQAFDDLIESGLAALGRRVPTGAGRHVLVFNRHGWARDGLVRVEGAGPDTQVVDLSTGEPAPVQADEAGSRWFAAHDVPPVGYKIFALRQATPAPQEPSGDWLFGATTLEGPRYRLEVSPRTGGIISLLDKARGVELVKQDAPYHLNQCLYLSDGVEHTPRSAQVRLRTSGALFAQLEVCAELKHLTVTTTITLYTDDGRVDIRNDVAKRPSEERQELDFAFPLAVRGGVYRFETPGAIVMAGQEQRPGAGMAVNAVRSFVDLSNDEQGVTLAMVDSHIAMFGRRTSQEDPTEPDTSAATIVALAFENLIDWNENVHGQDGVTAFTFRYSLRGHDAYDPVAAVRFGWENNNELLAVSLAAGQAGDLDAARHSFVQVTPDNVVLAGLKPAEDEGVIVRLWECAGRATEAMISAEGLGPIAGAARTDPLEFGDEPVELRGRRTSTPIAARGIATMRLWM